MIDNSWQEINESQYKGNVGIWWADQGKIYSFMHEVEDGKNYGGSVHTVTNHYKAWKHVVVSHVPSMTGKSYTTLPRGRVYYHKTLNKFYLVGTPTLTELPRFVEKIKQEFGCESLHVSNGADDHYTGELAPDILLMMKTVEYWR